MTIVMAQQGWQCPKCGNIISPNMMWCPFCSGEKNVTYTTTTSTTDRKTENSSEKPNNCDPLCSTCKYDEDKRFEVICNTCNSHRNHWQPKTEPQTEEWYTFQDEQEYNARYGKE